MPRIELRSIGGNGKKPSEGEVILAHPKSKQELELEEARRKRASKRRGFTTVFTPIHAGPSLAEQD